MLTNPQVNSANELVLTELILENVLAEYEPEEIVALLSCFVFQEKTDVVPNITQRLERGKATILAVAKRINNVQMDHQVLLSKENDDFESRPRFGLMEVVYEWAKGMSFSQITDLTDVLEGTIVRVITRLDETCREVKSAARIIGDPSLFEKMQVCQELIKRDVCHCASLYLVSRPCPCFPLLLQGLTVGYSERDRVGNHQSSFPAGVAAAVWGWEGEVIADISGSWGVVELYAMLNTANSFLSGRKKASDYR